MTSKTITRVFHLNELAAACVTRFVRYCATAKFGRTEHLVHRLFVLDNEKFAPKLKAQKSEEGFEGFSIYAADEAKRSAAIGGMDSSSAEHSSLLSTTYRPAHFGIADVNGLMIPIVRSSNGVVNHYRLLGLEIDATAREIKKAYHSLAKQHHSDRATCGAGGAGGADLMHELNEVNEVLSSEDTREEYDTQLRQQLSGVGELKNMVLAPTSRGSVAVKIYKGLNEHVCDNLYLGTIKAKCMPGLEAEINLMFTHHGERHVLEVQLTDVASGRKLTREFDLKELAAACITRFIRFCAMPAEDRTANLVQRLFLMDTRNAPELKAQKKGSTSSIQSMGTPR
jgi:hypothetical protein